MRKRLFDKNYRVQCLIEDKWVDQLGTEKMTIKRIKELVSLGGEYDHCFNETREKARIIKRLKK